MRRFHIGLVLIGSIALGSSPVALGQEASRFELQPGDRITVIGNTFVERMALSGYFDALVHAAHPDHQISIRHVPWSADEVALRPREHSVPTMETHLARHETDVIVMCFGMSESFGGQAGLAKFEADLDALLAGLGSEQFNGASPPRLILVSPVAHEDLGAPLVTGTELAQRNSDLATYSDAMRQTASAHDVTFVDLFHTSQLLYERESGKLTRNGIHPTELGCYHFTREIGNQLGWLTDAAGAPATAAAADQLRWLAFDKHYHQRLLYRPTNTEYVWGRRHEPFGVVNFPPEEEQLGRMIDARERAMWALDKPSTGALFSNPPRERAIWERVPSSRDFPEDSWNPAPVEAKGTETSLGSLDILDPDVFKEQITLPEGYVIDCFASEQDFEELANPLAMTFDNRGRLWVMCTPTYPHLMPGESPRCMLIILEDTDRDGKADQRTIFADQLYIPTGFAIDTDAVYIGQAPDLWKYTDVDGDDRADAREIVASGFGMPDSHHQVSAFEWEPNGGFVFHEGVFTKSNVETPWGTLRTRDAATWRFDPRTERLQVLSHCSFANPWGHVFDDYGQSVLADASGGDNFSFSHVITAYDYPRKPGRVGRFLNRGRPTAGCELISSRHFPDDVQETFLVNQSIGFHGTRWSRMQEEGSAWSGQAMPQDLVDSADTNFRPVGIETGPDGALYVLDWCNPIIGHMQYSVRDPRRDHAHGRVWVVRYEQRPLLLPPEIANTTLELLEQLRLPERNTRQHIRRRLQKMAPADVFPDLISWLAGLDPADPLHDRLVLEGLWLHQAHGRVDVDFLEHVTSLAEPRARAGGVRVLRHWLQDRAVDSTDALPIIERAAGDDDMRVRLEAVVACGFIPSVAGASLAAIAAEQEMDDGLRIALEQTIEHLSRYGEPQSDIVRRLRLYRAPVDDLLALPVDDVVASVMLVRPDVDEKKRNEALAFLAGDDTAAHVDRLIGELVQTNRRDSAIEAIAPLLLSMAPDELRASRNVLTQAALQAEGRVRALLISALVLVDPAYSAMVAGNAGAATDVLSFLQPAQAPANTVEALTEAVEGWRAEPVPAIEQIARHTPDRAGLYTWLAGLIDDAQENAPSPFDPRHENALAALRVMNQTSPENWPAGMERYRVEPADPDVLAAGKAIYLDEITGCVRCHAKDGQGEEGFPPLDGSPWVLGDPERAAAIVVHGMFGQIHFPSRVSFDAVMDPLGAQLDDEQIAAVLTYVRQSWGNYASAVGVDVVRAARAVKAEDGQPLHASVVMRDYPMSRDRLVPVLSEARVMRPLASRTFFVVISIAIVLTLLIGAAMYVLGREETPAH